MYHVLEQNIARNFYVCEWVKQLTNSRCGLYATSMIMLFGLLIGIFLLLTPQSFCVPTWAEQFKQVGYVELCDSEQGAVAYNALYACFDGFIAFLQTHPAWVHKLYSVKERFIRSREKDYYSTIFFGFYDESERVGRSQIAFYYSTHFHEFICARYPEFKQIPEIIRFFDACHEIQKPYNKLFVEAASELGLEEIFASAGGQVPLLLKVVKYLPAYCASRPHYDGTAFSLFLDSTDNQSLLLAPYKSSFTLDDFSCPSRQFPRGPHHNSLLLIPGTLLADSFIFPTPHLVVGSGAIRYATIAFALRPYYSSQKNEFTLLPVFTT